MPRLSSRVKRQKLASLIVARLQKEFPNPHCELYYETPYQLLVSVVLSAQTTDKSVNRQMEPLYRQGFGPETALAWGQELLLSKIRTIGLAPTKSKNVIKLTQILMEKYQGKVPHSREALEALPGVGRKTANVVLGEIFKEPTLAVDTHVFRVTTRLALQKEANPLKAEKELLLILDQKVLPAAHHLFIFLGRYVCQARKPACASCVLQDICAYNLEHNKGKLV